MAEARSEHFDRLAWNRTFATLAMIRNVNLADPKRDHPVDPMKFFPWKKQSAGKQPTVRKLTNEDRAMLKAAFPPRGSKA